MNYTAFAQVQTRSTKFSLYFNIIALLGIHSKVNPRNKGSQSLSCGCFIVRRLKIQKKLSFIQGNIFLFSMKLWAHF